MSHEDYCVCGHVRALHETHGYCQLCGCWLFELEPSALRLRRGKSEEKSNDI
jgi:hypothetical protein